MTRLPAVVLSAAVLAALPPHIAQSQASGGAQDASVAALRGQWQGTTRNITAAAEEMSDADYAYRPIASVRTFGQLLGHIAGTQNLLCAVALGDAQPAEDAVERAATTKAALVQALKASNEYCSRAYAMSGSALGASANFFGQAGTKVGALMLNAVHNGEHYGNIVTYMRMKGMVPPSSKE